MVLRPKKPRLTENNGNNGVSYNLQLINPHARRYRKTRYKPLPVTNPLQTPVKNED